MLPVSGAEQLKSSDAHTLAPISPARCAYSRFVRPGPVSNFPSSPFGMDSFRSSRESAGSHRFQSPADLASAFNSSTFGHTLHRSGVAAWASRMVSAAYTWSHMNRRSLTSSAPARALGSKPAEDEAAAGTKVDEVEAEVRAMISPPASATDLPTPPAPTRAPARAADVEPAGPTEWGTPLGVTPATTSARAARISTTCPAADAFAAAALPATARALTPARIAAPRNNESAT
mmetsp:Transcript_1761/g.4005  ORF Transcript_1761/g.4005 Transcript_1761/m.4005 type:complete len:232 (-) Transcript_1761:21-716(-)